MHTLAPFPVEQGPVDTISSSGFEGVAAELGIEIDAERIARLEDFASHFEKIRSQGREDKYRDYQHDIYIGVSGAAFTQSDQTIFQRDGTANIDFLPFVDGEDEAYASAVPLRHVAQTVHNVIQGLQDYVLLVKSGYIREPIELRGETNHEMVGAAKRVGFVSTGEKIMCLDDGQEKTVVSSLFTALAEHVFSDEIVRLDRALTKRIATNRTGQVALSQ